MRQTLKDSLLFVLATLLVCMGTTWPKSQETISFDAGSETRASEISGRVQTSMVLQDGVQIHAEEQAPSDQDDTEPSILPLCFHSSERTAPNEQGLSIGLPPAVVLKFTSLDAVFPFHEFS